MQARAQQTEIHPQIEIQQQAQQAQAEVRPQIEIQQQAQQAEVHQTTVVLPPATKVQQAEHKVLPIQVTETLQ